MILWCCTKSESFIRQRVIAKDPLIAFTALNLLNHEQFWEPMVVSQMASQSHHKVSLAWLHDADELIEGWFWTHVYEEELHLCFCNSASKALSGPKSEPQAPKEAGVTPPQPAWGLVLLWSREDLVVTAHGIKAQLDQGLFGKRQSEEQRLIIVTVAWQDTGIHRKWIRNELILPQRECGSSEALYPQLCTFANSQRQDVTCREGCQLGIFTSTAL